MWFSPLSRAADFGIGMGLALLIAAGVRPGRAARGTLAVVGIAATLALVLTRPLTAAGEWWHPACALTIAAALASIVLHDGPWPRALHWRPGAFFMITAALVVVPTIALAWLSSRTVEAAGLRLLKTQERDGSPRDYYARLRDEDVPAGPEVRTGARGRAAAPR